jgi:hypothetical protein
MATSAWHTEDEVHTPIARDVVKGGSRRMVAAAEMYDACRPPAHTSSRSLHSVARGMARNRPLPRHRSGWRKTKSRSVETARWSCRVERKTTPAESGTSPPPCLCACADYASALGQGIDAVPRPAVLKHLWPPAPLATPPHTTRALRFLRLREVIGLTSLGGVKTKSASGGHVVSASRDSRASARTHGGPTVGAEAG